MSKRFPYRPGDALGVCDRCGEQYYHSELRRDGDSPGLLVCEDCYDPEHPQTDIHAIPMVRSVKDARPLRDPVYIFEDENDYANRMTADDYPSGF